jgi:hypothetical protein
MTGSEIEVLGYRGMRDELLNETLFFDLDDVPDEGCHSAQQIRADDGMARRPFVIVSLLVHPEAQLPHLPD